MGKTKQLYLDDEVADWLAKKDNMSGFINDLLKKEMDTVEVNRCLVCNLIFPSKYSACPTCESKTLTEQAQQISNVKSAIETEVEKNRIAKLKDESSLMWIKWFDLIRSEPELEAKLMQIEDEAELYTIVDLYRERGKKIGLRQLKAYLKEKYTQKTTAD